MLVLKEGSIFDSKCDVLVNPVNTVGVMGAGLALEFKKRKPLMFAKYLKACREGFSVGQLLLVDGVLCFPTKEEWRKKSKIEYIEAGLVKFVDTYKEKGIKSIAFPLLGCGLGGLDADEVLALMRKYLSLDDLEVEIYV